MRTRAWHLIPFTCLVLACGGDGGGPSSTGTISGSVTSAASGAPLAGATVSVGSRQATSDAAGHFDLTGVPTGAATLGCAQPGYVAYSAAITVQEGSNTRDIALATQEVFGYGTFALFVPAGVPQVRAVIVALGGPDTRAFVDGHRAIDEDIPQLEAALQAMGEQFRALARDSGFAVIGSGTERWVNDPATDAVILGALQTGAAASDHPELASAPLIMFGISAGGTGAFGIMQRQASRVAGFAMLVPTGLGNFLSTAAQQVPGYVSLAELDDVVDNVPTTQDFLSNRAAGAIWGLAVEPGRGAPGTLRRRSDVAGELDHDGGGAQAAGVARWRVAKRGGVVGLAGESRDARNRTLREFCRRSIAGELAANGGDGGRLEGSHDTVGRRARRAWRILRLHVSHPRRQPDAPHERWSPTRSSRPTWRSGCSCRAWAPSRD